MKKSLFIIFILFISIFVCTSCFKENNKKYNTKNGFNIKLIKSTIKKENYLNYLLLNLLYILQHFY